ncbi:hypothetical protein ACJX0J_029257, partial [Zea mays]
LSQGKFILASGRTFILGIILKVNFALNFGREYYMQGTWKEVDRKNLDSIQQDPRTTGKLLGVFMWLCLCEELENEDHIFFGLVLKNSVEYSFVFKNYETDLNYFSLKPCSIFDYVEIL